MTTHNVYDCKMCNFRCTQKCDWERHIKTRKHEIKNNVIGSDYQCSCGKSYKSYSGYWKHKNKCSVKGTWEQPTNTSSNDIIMKLLKQNDELHNKLIQLTSMHSNTTTTTTNIEKNFNLNFFLNETCKNALNMTDFVNSIKLSLEDLENTGRNGYIEGISNIIIKNLNNLEIKLRPIHCSDRKRETLYFKENDEWMKESEHKHVLTNAINNIANENMKQISQWKKMNPDCLSSSSTRNDMYLKIIGNSVSGFTDEESEKNNSRIISNIAKQVKIDKII